MPSGEAKPSRGLVAYIASLIVASAAVAVVSAAAGLRPPGRASWAVLPILGMLVVAAEYMLVRFRYAGQVNALNAVEAALAPVLFAFPVWAVVVTVGLAMVAGDALRRNLPLKAAFNAGQWSLSAGIAGVIVSLAAGRGTSVFSILVLIGALAVLGVLNQMLFTIVISLAQRTGLRPVLRGLAPVVVPGWLGGWVANLLIGLLFVFAYATHPASSLLFGLPLAMLHFAYRGYAAARSDRVRLAGLHRAASALSEPLEPIGAIPTFLAEVARCFEARGAALAVVSNGGWLVHTFSAEDEQTRTRYVDGVAGALEPAVAHLRRPARIGATHRLAPALAAAGWRECLSAPLLEDGVVCGALLVFDQIGLEGFEDGELAVVEALARETAGVFAKGALVRATLEDRAKLALIVGSTSDGIFTVGEDGLVKSWNAAIETITGWPATEVMERPDALMRLDMRTESGGPVRLAAWADGTRFPQRVVVTARDGATRRLSCSYSAGAAGDDGDRMLIVIARDVTTAREMEELREEYGRLVRAEASHRAVVDQLQQAVMPTLQTVEGADSGVAYLASDPSSPTGGDLYDWHVLPSGEVHIAVIDVLGHGVAATKDALSVIHTLRLLALEGCPLEEIVGRADELLAAQRRELVATVLLGRYDDATGLLRLAGGGHPPPLHVTPGGGVREVALNGGAVGWPGAGSDGVVEVRLEPGGSIVMYTDGLVEAGRNIVTGIEELIIRAQTLADLPAEAIAARLLGDSPTREERPDDALVLVLRRRPLAIRTSWNVTAGPDEAHMLRRELAAWLTGLGLGSGDVEDTQLIVSELLTNAVEASASRVEVGVSVEPRSLSLEVTDDGPGRHDLDELGLELPPLEAERGRGLYIVRSIADHVSFVHRVGGPTVRVVRLLLQPPQSIENDARSRETSPA